MELWEHVRGSLHEAAEARRLDAELDRLSRAWTPYFLGRDAEPRALLYITEETLRSRYQAPTPNWWSRIRAATYRRALPFLRPEVIVLFEPVDGAPRPLLETDSDELPHADPANLIADHDAHTARAARVARAMHLLQRDRAFEPDRRDVAWRLRHRQRMLDAGMPHDAQAVLHDIMAARRALLLRDPIYCLLEAWERGARLRAAVPVRNPGGGLAVALPPLSEHDFAPEMLGAPGPDDSWDVPLVCPRS